MAKQMKAKELRAQKVEELAARVQTLQEDLLGARFKHRLGQLQNSSELDRLRKEIARAKTILRERS